MLFRNSPILCNYYVTYRCNAKCGFCDIWEKPSPFATIENVENNLEHLRKLGVRIVDFTGGEPLLNRNLDIFLKMAKNRGFITTVTTNTLLYPKMARQLSGLIDMLHFSVDSADEIKHNISRGVSCYNKILESLEIARELNEKPDILFTVTDESVAEIEDVYNIFCKQDGLILILNPVFSYNGIGGGLSEKSLEILIQHGKKKDIYLNDAFIKLRRDGGNQIHDPVCKAATTTIVISPENKLIVPCYHLSHADFQIQNNLYDLIHTQEVESVRKMEGRMPGCQGCSINCYMQPSFAVNFNTYWLHAASSSLKYALKKGTWKQYGKKHNYPIPV